MSSDSCVSQGSGSAQVVSVCLNTGLCREWPWIWRVWRAILLVIQTLPTVGGWSSLTKVKLLSRVQLFGIPWTVAYQAPLSMGFSRQGYWSGLSFPSPGDLTNPGIEPGSPTLQPDALPSEPPGKLWQKWERIMFKPIMLICSFILRNMPIR